MKTYVRLIVAGDQNLPQKHCCLTLNILIYLTVTRSSPTHSECIVPFQLQQRLRKSAHNTYFAYLV